MRTNITEVDASCAGQKTNTSPPFLTEPAVFAGGLVFEDAQPEKKIDEAREAPRKGDELRPEEARRQMLRNGGRDADADEEEGFPSLRRGRLRQSRPSRREEGKIEDRELKNHR